MATGNSIDSHGNAGEFIFRQNLLTESLLYGIGTGGRGEWDCVVFTGGRDRAIVAAELSRLYDEPRTSIVKALLLIETTFGLTKKLLADVCGVTRRTVYKWLDKGVTPNPQFQKRIFKLREAALNWQNEAFPHPKEHLHEPIVSKRTLLDLLKEDPVDVQTILFAGQRLMLAELDESNEVIPDPFE